MNKKSKWVFVIVSILSFVGTCIAYFYLPDQIPTHWNINWEIDQWSDKNYIFILGLLPLFIVIMFEFLPRFDPRRDNYKKHTKAYDILEIATVLLMIIMNWITVLAAFQTGIKIKLILPACLGIIFIVIGNYLPVIKSNYFFGIKNPWTLSDNLVWRKTHKVGGYVFAISGILMILIAFIQNKIMYSIVGTEIIIGIIGINVYSYLIYRKLKNKKRI